ncbi:RnfH family protein [Luteimonas abyssi]|uniref:RnfH family protein n=1 Tax=Luteimonas abyssi TaxID=1247514 RepID=UPI000737AF01|nr:RnfH family protein [Luteimonas abyssi]
MSDAGPRVDVVLAWPRQFESVTLTLAPGARVADALARCGLPMDGVDGVAVFGERVAPDTPLHDGDRLELLRPLQVDPKDARRRRAAERPARK